MMATQYMFSPQMHYGSQFAPYSAAPQYNPAAGSGFKNRGFSFRKRVERIDWRKMASVDVDHIAQTLDFNALQENIMNITFCSLESEIDIRTVDPNFVKLFKLAQLTIEYLLYSQEYLAGLCTDLEGKIKISQEEQEKGKLELEEVRKELSSVKAESHKRKKLLIAQQQLMHAGAGSYQKCPFCTKAFLNNSYLQSHIIRRHNSGVVYPPGSQRGSGDSVPKASSPDQGVGESLAQNPQFEAELAQLKERLQATEVQLEQERKVLTSLRAKESKINILVDDRVESMTKQLIDLHKQEKEEIRSIFMKELRERQEKYVASERALVELEQRYGVKRSYLGASLQDDAENDKDALQEELWKQIDAVEDKLQDTLASQEKRRQRRKEKKQKDQQVSAAKAAAAAAAVVTEMAMEDEVLPFDVHHEAAEPAKATPFKEEARPKQTTMYPSDEEDGSAFGTGTSSLKTPRTPGRASSLGSSGGTLGMTDTGTLELGTSQFLEKFRQNPSLGLMREQLAELLAEKVEKCGIPRGTPGIDSTILQTKLAMRSTQRKSELQKYPNFLELRARFDREAEERALKKINHQKKQSPRNSGINMQSDRGYQATSRSASASRAQLTTTQQQEKVSNHNTPRSSSMPSPRPRVHTMPRSMPQPQPRASSPPKTGLSTGSTEFTSTQWDSDEDEESESELSGIKPFSPTAPNVRLIQSGPRPFPSPRQQPKATGVIQSKPVEEDLDSILGSDVEENSRAKTQPVSVHRPQTRLTSSAPQPRGSNVSNLARDIEKQLGARNTGSKPIGGIDLAGSSVGQKNKADVLEDYVESDWDETEDPAPPPVRAAGGSAAVRRSGPGSTDLSTNTYGTSQWGSSSKGASTAKPDPKRPASINSFVSVTDVSSDEDMNDDNV